MFDFLANKFSTLFSRLSGQGTISVQQVEQTVQQIKDTLLDADVPYDVVEAFIASVQQEIIGKKILTSLKPSAQLAKVMHDKLVLFLGGQQALFTFQLPSVVMVMGLQGCGKTTSIAKLAYHINKQAQQRGKARRILVGSVDFYRPAAIDQLYILAQQIGVEFYRAQSTDPIKAAQEIYTHYKNGQYELLLLDTAGRLHVDSYMLEELRSIDEYLAPKYKLLVLDAMTGQESLAVARAFDQHVGFMGALLTKMDSDARGGAAFAFCYAIKKPIVFIGTGERPEDIAPFHPERMAGRILGMGDIQSLIEHANDTIRQTDQKQINQSFSTGKMTLYDFAQQLDMMTKMGSLSQIMQYIPGAGSLSTEQLEQGQTELKRFRAVMHSMTPKERIFPHIIDNSRKKRIAKGAGVTVQDINLLLQRFEQMQQYAKLLKRSGFKNMFR